MIESIRPMDNVKNYYIVVIDGVTMTLACSGNPMQAINKLFGVE